MSSESQTNVSSPQDAGQNNLQENWGWFLALGIGLICVGAMAIILPGLATMSVTLILGWLLVIGGIFHAVHAFYVRNWSGFFMQGVMAFVYLTVGLILLANPVQAVFMLTLLLAAFFLFEGLVKIFMAFQVRPMQNWGWIFFSGVLALVLSAIIWMNWPGDALWVIGMLVGVNILFSGWATVMIALGARGISTNWCCGGNRNVTPST
ncbi:MAG: HdeD family acid-resistance protein [Pirellulales bacterium]|nr:HdeD family acid-resistance protein [Pirellulales bacterium]